MGPEQFMPSYPERKQPSMQFPALDGIRGVAFLMVFVIHYVHLPASFPRPVKTAYFLFQETGWFLVPLFFALSGFLITRLLLRTREREGYFRVFYLHRVIRIFPLYYLTIGVVALLALVQHWHLTRSHLLFAFYLQNFSTSILKYDPLPFGIDVIHLWSMAIEEQFYLLWPLAIWFLRTEKALLRFCFVLIGASTLVRLVWPHFHTSPDAAYFSTFTRGDAIILGAILALLHPQPEQWNRLVKAARVLTPALWVAAIAVAYVRGQAHWYDYFGVTCLIPLMNMIGAGLVILAIEPAGAVYRFCSGSLICRFGKLSYGMYLFHLLYASFFQENVMHAMSAFMPETVAKIAVDVLALVVTVILAELTSRLVENPLLAFKKRFSYGPVSQKAHAPYSPMPVSPALLMNR
jgi:peptidoglycan/LPS O-acetylase OafA/YrhL